MYHLYSHNAGWQEQTVNHVLSVYQARGFPSPLPNTL